MRTTKTGLKPQSPHSRLGAIGRAVAVALALVWGSGGIVGLMVAYFHHRWLLVVPACFAIWYAVLWVRVAASARLLRWQDIAMPWRAR